MSNTLKQITKFDFNSEDMLFEFNAPLAEEYVGKTCYVGDSYHDIVQHIKEGCKFTLRKVVYDEKGLPVQLPFRAELNGIRMNYRYMLLEEDVKILTTYTAFTSLQEFQSETGLDVRSPVKIRKKRQQNVEYSTMIMSILTNTDTGYTTITFGTGETRDFKELFCGYEVFVRGRWLPFGKKNGE